MSDSATMETAKAAMTRAAEAAIARRSDAPELAEAALEQLRRAQVEQQAEFVQWWREKVTLRSGLNRHNLGSADPGSLTQADAESLAGITHQQVRSDHQGHP